MLRNKTVFITGASSGIGEACAKQFSEQGATLLLCARNIAKLAKLTSELQSTYQNDIYPLQLDVSHADSVSQTFQALPNKWKQIDILINNAGLAAGLETLQEGQTEDWEKMIDTNVKGLLYITKAVLPHMIEKNAGHIINISSVSAHRVYAKGAVYCASKHAVKAITQGLRLDLAGKKIRVTSIDPGAVKTNFSNVRFKGDNKRAAAVYDNMQALTAEDIADSIIYCATRPLHVNISELIIMPTDQT